MNTPTTPSSLNPQVTVFGLPNCDTVKKARAWLSARGVRYEFHDFKKLGVPTDQLPRWIDAVGWEPLLNRKGTTWRKLDENSRAEVLNAASASALMLAHPGVVKRPVVAWPSAQITVGFDEAKWQEFLPLSLTI